MESMHLCLFTLLCLGAQLSSSKILHRQKRDWIIESFKIMENETRPLPYPLGHINIESNFTIFKLTGHGYDEDPVGVLNIDENSGNITVHKRVDYEKHRLLKLTFMAVRKSNHKEIDTQLGIEIHVIDANDNKPTFINSLYKATIPASTKQGTDVITVHARDNDTSVNGQFHLKIANWSPKHDNVEFFLKSTGPASATIGTIYFKGCLDYKKAQKYTIIMLAIDHGEAVQNTGSCTVIVNVDDGNDHPPEIIGQTGPRRVKEGLENVPVLRVKVSDDDYVNTPAWRAVYKIKGDSENNFNITTDPKTNEGVLSVVKALDFEKVSHKNLTITVENEIPFHFCKIQDRKQNGLWEVIDESLSGQASIPVSVIVEDVNDAPEFLKKSQRAPLKENAGAGRYLSTFTATDSDVASGTTITYKIAGDKADWITVDPKNGKVTTKKSVDRESAMVKNNTYIVNVLAIDNGIPPMTGTATLTIDILDENDNSPYLAGNTLEMCLSDKPTKAQIKALDLDEGIYGGPFTFKILGDVKGKWRVEPPHGFSTYLVKESQVHSADYELMLQIADMQQQEAVHNLSVTVCKCIDPEIPNCRTRKSTASAAGGPVIGIIFAALLLIAGLLLLAFLVSCKKLKSKIPDDEGSEQHLMKCNMETPGTDCKVASKHQVSSSNGELIKSKYQVQNQTANQTIVKTKTTSVSQAPQVMAQSASLQRQANYHYSSMGASASMRTRQKNRSSMQRSSGRQRIYSAEMRNGGIQQEFVTQALNTRLYGLHAPGEELGDYAPRVYAEETMRDTNAALDAISIPDLPFDPEVDLNLDSRFSHLASVCMPSESIGYNKYPEY